MRLATLLVLCFIFNPLWSQRKDAIKDFNKAREYVKQEEFKKALESLNDALEEDPSFVDVYLFKADVFKVLNQADSALAQYQKARNYDPPYYIDLFQGRLLYDLERYEEAVLFLKSYKEHPRANKRYLAEIDRKINSAHFALETEANQFPFNPKNLGELVNTDQLEYFPSISADGRTLVFTHRKLEGSKLDEDFWLSRRDSVGAPWQQAQLLRGKLNTAGNEGAQSINAYGDIIFFAACDRPDGFGSCDIFASFLNEQGVWSKAVNMGPAINSGAWESQPSISPDGKTLYFVRGRSGDDRKMNIFQSEFKNGKWTKAIKVPGQINTGGQETSPFIHFDNEHLYFSSNGHPGMGDLDFFVSEKQADGTWGEPLNLGKPINTAFQEFSLIVSPDGQTGYFSSDALEEGFGKLDLYEFLLPPPARALPVAYLEGKVIDKETRENLQAQLEFKNLKDSAKVVRGSTNRSGDFYVVLPAQSNYGLSVAKPGYLFYSRNFALESQSRESALRLVVELIPLKSGQSVVLENIFFDTDSYLLDERSDNELAEIVLFLEMNPGLKVSIEGHTDNQGSVEHNKILSENRAKAVFEALQALGISEDRMDYKGFGSSRPIADNSKEKGRAQNRRTEMKVL